MKSAGACGGAAAEKQKKDRMLNTRERTGRSCGVGACPPCREHRLCASVMAAEIKRRRNSVSAIVPDTRREREQKGKKRAKTHLRHTCDLQPGGARPHSLF